MTAPHASEIIHGYLSRLEGETADLPRRERRELIDGVREHIAEARAQLANETDANLLTLLDRLGDPGELAAEERDRLGIRGTQLVRVGLVEIGALVLTPLIWPIGVILLWASGAWNVRDKLIGTLVPPGGLFTSLSIGAVLMFAEVGPARACNTTVISGHMVTHCAGGAIEPGAFIASALGMVLLLAPVLTGMYMGIRLRRGVGSRRGAAYA